MVNNPDLPVSELFYSIQGESSLAGLPCAFVRFSGCNLRCRYCDSAHTWEEPGSPMSTTAILRWLESYPGVPVELTGGEPLLQEGIYPLMEKILAGGRRVLLETNGSLSIAGVPPAVKIILDLKCPGSGMENKNDWSNIGLLAQRCRKQGSNDEIKFVLCSERDYFWAGRVIAEHRLADLATLLFSPVAGSLSPRRLAKLMLADRSPARLQLQLHKIIWPGQDRGV